MQQSVRNNWESHPDPLAGVRCSILDPGRPTLANREDLRVAVVVRDRSDMDVDASLVESEAMLGRAVENFVEMSNGCIRLTWREELLVEVSGFVGEGRSDYLSMELNGVSEPFPAAETFRFRGEHGAKLQAAWRGYPTRSRIGAPPTCRTNALLQTSPGSTAPSD
ncbi:MAG: CobW-like GTP-binding protein [Methylotetracoccus sp.]|nr:CobW-like GTP-binding protein [Methylotetracoccus sp.]